MMLINPKLKIIFHTPLIIIYPGKAVADSI